MNGFGVTGSHDIKAIVNKCITKNINLDGRLKLNWKKKLKCSGIK